MTIARQTRKRLEGELERVERQLRELEPGLAALQEEGTCTGDIHEWALISENKESAYGIRSRLWDRRSVILEALRRLQEGSYGTPTPASRGVPERLQRPPSPPLEGTRRG